MRFITKTLNLRQGLKVKKILELLEFNQSQWWKQYVYFKTRKRTEAENNGDKEYSMLYRKAMESLTNRINVRLAGN